MNIARVAVVLLAAAVAPAFGAAPAWDSSGNGQLSGIYYFREVRYAPQDDNGTINQATALYGNITFSSGTYTLSGASLNDTGGGFGVSATGTYSVSASGYGFLSDPLVGGGSVNFLVSNGVLVGSDTESGYNGVFIAAPKTASLSNASLNGTYSMNAYFPVLPQKFSDSYAGYANDAGDATFQLQPNGAGGFLSSVAINGMSGGGTGFSQNSSATYFFSNSAAVIQFNKSASANFFPNQLYLYPTPDSNFVFGGTPDGYDLVVGVKNASGSTTLSGLYYQAGMEESVSLGAASYYGSFNAYPGDSNLGNSIGQKRRFVPGYLPYNYTYYSAFSTSIAPAAGYPDPAQTAQYVVGANGIRIGTGIGASISISVALPYTSPTPTASIYLDPTGIVSTASSAPYTAGIAPGSFMTIYGGTGLANSQVPAAPGAFPTTLGGVKVLVDGIAAPLSYVSPQQISFVVPYDVSSFGLPTIASIQVNNNGALSNVVTTYVHATGPGAFTNTPTGGTGIAAIRHLDASILSTDNPAQPGEILSLYLAGLGTPFPSVAAGALGPEDPGNSLVGGVQLDLDQVPATISFAGLAPDLAGLYQINFTVPSTLATGTTYALGIMGLNSGGVLDSYSNESLIPVGTSTSSARPSTDTPAAQPSARKFLPRLSNGARPQ